ncbi:hypothetical protein B0J13DRAFT_241865 [Dactylonectria estremocensis]|uniref:Transcription factor domain-containing protein n=1 Tax=Dactylonectria estremocensis TaxID=1079267 RepID=A0A9P9D797_9HYPO|nr:hypothetical protein B0J13DRAFT_241865 [Dactylonectria estremocensis]
MSVAKKQPIGFHFINVAHPSDATTPRSLSQIRSHAAKDNRARAKNSRSLALLLDETSRARPRRRPQALSVVACEVENNESRHAQERDPVNNSTPPTGEFPASNDTQISWLSSKDPLWSPARALSAKETFLLNHYISYLILFRNGRCHQLRISSGYDVVDDSAGTWFTSMQLQCWLPFALADIGLLAVLFLQSCHSLGILSGFQNYSGMYDIYKHQCIRSINKALSAEDTRISDATICMVMVMVGDSYSLGNIDEWEVHLRAFTNMIEMRGGLDSLGLDGFLKKVILKSPQIFKQRSS